MRAIRSGRSLGAFAWGEASEVAGVFFLLGD